MSDSGSYYIPHGSKWPIIASIAVCTAMVGGSTLLNGNPSGKYILFVGLVLIVFISSLLFIIFLHRRPILPKGHRCRCVTYTCGTTKKTSLALCKPYIT